MDCDHDWRRSPFRMTLRRILSPNGRGQQMDVSFDVCSKCGALRVDPSEAGRLLPR